MVLLVAKKSSVTNYGVVRSCTLSNKFAPAPDLGRYPSFGILPQPTLGYLLFECLDEQLGTPRVIQQRDAEVDSVSAIMINRQFTGSDAVDPYRLAT